MPKSPTKGPGSNDSSKVPRSQTRFRRTSWYDEALNAIQPPKHGVVIAHVQTFERAWKASKTNEDIPPGYQFKRIEVMKGAYTLHQIYITSDFRAIMMFPRDTSSSYWIYVWKKTSQNDRAAINRAKQIAARLWATM